MRSGHTERQLAMAIRASKRSIMYKGLVCVVLTLSLLAFQSAAPAAQTCKYGKIPASAPASRFTFNGDGTATDKATGLEWKRCHEGQVWNGLNCLGDPDFFGWHKALQHAEDAVFADRDDWHLPNIKELMSVVEQACHSPAIDLGVFPDTFGGNIGAPDRVDNNNCSDVDRCDTEKFV